MVSREIVQLTNAATNNYSLFGEIRLSRIFNFKNFIRYIWRFFYQTLKIKQNGPATENVSHKITLQ